MLRYAALRALPDLALSLAAAAALSVADAADAKFDSAQSVA